MERMSPSGVATRAGHLGGRALSCCAGLAALLLILATLVPALAQGDPQFFRIGTGVVDSPSFAVAGIVAAGLSSPPGARPCDRGGSCGVPGLIALAQSIGSPAEAIDLLEQRQLDAILVPANEAHRANLTRRPDAGGKPRETLRAVGTLFLEAAHLLVREGSDIRGIEALRERPVAIATDDPAAATFLQAYAGQLGLDGGKPAPLPLQAALTRLADSRVDALLVVATPRLPALVDFMQAVPVRLLDLPAPSGAAPYLTELKLPAGVYPGLPELVAPGLPVQLLVAASADTARVEAITRALWNDSTQKLLSAGPPVARAVKPDRALMGVTVPLHPGAARFYREVGLLNGE